MTETAHIITSYGRRYIVRTTTGQLYDATTRKKRVDFACGDWVDIVIQNAQQAVIEDFQPRKSLLYRQDAWKTKLIAANVERLFIVLAAIPSPSEILLQRALLAAEAGKIEPFIVLNKTDLPETTLWRKHLAIYQDWGYPLIEVSALNNVEPMRPFLTGYTSIFLGQSGMGKSTLTNALLGKDLARTNHISTALNSGKHTTTHAQLYDLSDNTFLIDSPGLQEFGLHHLAVSDLLHYFPDMRHLIGKCRFHNCSHRNEPHCAIKTAVEQGQISANRLTFLQRITNELSRS